MADSEVRQKRLQKMQQCLHVSTKKVCAGLVTDTLYRCQQIVAEECLECGALFSADLPKIPGVERGAKHTGTIQ